MEETLSMAHPKHIFIIGTRNVGIAQHLKNEKFEIPIVKKLAKTKRGEF